jgi:predicted DNA-binding transcriptional regulator AlpA
MRVLRVPHVCEALSCSRKTLWRIRRTDPSFPQPRKITAGISGWLQSDLDKWLEARPTVAEGRADR